jgi:HEAT repeat protein
MDVDALIQGLQSRDWQVAVDAATKLRTVPGERVTRALAEALDAFEYRDHRRGDRIVDCAGRLARGRAHVDCADDA